MLSIIIENIGDTVMYFKVDS